MMVAPSVIIAALVYQKLDKGHTLPLTYNYNICYHLPPYKIYMLNTKIMLHNMSSQFITFPLHLQIVMHGTLKLKKIYTVFIFL